MERQRLHKLVEAPEQLSKADIAGLEALRDKYPWFSSAHLLLALGELNDENIIVSEKLSRTAIAIPSRVSLFNASQHSKSALAAPAPSAELSVVPAEIAPKAEESVPEDKASAAEDSKQSHDLPLTKKMTTFKDDDELDKLIRSEAAKNTITLDLLQQKLESFEPGITRTTKPVTEPEPAKEFDEESLNAENVEPFTGKMSFTQWLAPDAPAQKEKSVPEEKIEHFIEERKQKAQEKVAFFSASKMAKKSLEDKGGLVTETLAKIYLAQGNAEKAIEAYLALSEKHPAKKGYYLSRIKEIEKKLKEGEA